MGRPRTDISTRILHAARARFLVDGVDGASLRTIAKDAKTNIGMIFYYYPTKEALFLAVVEEVYAKLLHDLENALNPELPPSPARRSAAKAEKRASSSSSSSSSPLRLRLAAAFARLGHATPEELDVIRLVVREALVSSPRLQDLMSRFRRGHIGLLLGALAEGAEQGELDPNIPLPFLLIATFAMGAAPQLARRIAGDQIPFAEMSEPEALAAASIDLLFRAIGAQPTTTTTTTTATTTTATPSAKTPVRRAPKKRQRVRSSSRTSS